MDIITTQSRGNNFAEVVQDFILEDTPRTRTVFRAAMHPGGIRGDIIRFRKDSTGKCEEIVPVNFNSLHPDDGVKISLATEPTKILYEKLKQLEVLLEERGIHYGVRDFALTDARALVINDRNKAAVIHRLLEADLGQEVWDALVQSNPNIATRLAHSRLHETRVAVLHQFEAMLADDSLNENAWQSFFEENTWIFGYGLRYQIIRVVQAQPNYGGAAVNRQGGQRGDFLGATEAETKYSCLVEIKKPETQLLQREEYRNGAWGISADLSGAISQIQVNCAQWEITDARNDHNRELLADIYTIHPKGIVIIGNTNQLNNWDKRNSFERFRRELSNPEVITYDELYERAKFIVGIPNITEIEEEEEELPF